MIFTTARLILLSFFLVMIASQNVKCEESQKELNANELHQLRNLLSKYLALESEQSDELDGDDLKEKKSILLPRIGSAKRSPIVFPRIGYEKKRGYHMPRIGRNLNDDLISQEDDYEKRAIHMPRIGRK